jgi:translocation and assembly module TamB
MTIEPSPKKPPRSRTEQWLLGTAAVLTGLLLAVIATALVLLNGLERPWLKRRVQALVLATSGVEIDYGAVHIDGFSGLHVDEILVRSPVEMRGVAPEMLRIGRLRAAWSPTLLIGKKPSIREVSATRIALTIVVDENGRTSLQAIPTKPNPAPATPISRQTAELLGATSLLRKVRLDDVHVFLIQTERERAVTTYALGGLSLDVDAEPHGPIAQLRVALGKPDAPLDLRLERSRAGTGFGSATAQLSLVAELRRADAKIALDLRVLHQDLAPPWPIERIARLDATAQFDAVAGRTELTLTHVELADGATTAHAAIEWRDQSPPVLRNASGDADIGRLQRLLPRELLPIRVKQGTLHYRVENLAFDRPLDSASFALDGDGTDIEMNLANGSVAVGATTFSLQAQPRGTDITALGSIGLDELRFTSGAMELRASGGKLTFDGRRRGDRALSGRMVLRFSALKAIGQRSASLSNGHVALEADELVVDPVSPEATRGEISLEASAAFAEIQLTSSEKRNALSAALAAPNFRAHLPLTGRRPFALESEFAATRLRVLGRDGEELVNLSIRLALELKKLIPNLEQPMRTQGTVRAALTVGALRAALDATKRGDDIDYVASANATQLGELSPFLPQIRTSRSGWDKTAFELESKGRLTRLSASEPNLGQHTQLRVSGLNLGALATRALELEVDSSGTSMRHDVHANVHTDGLVVGNAALGENRLSLSATIDRAQRSLLVELDNTGVSKAALRAALEFDRTDHVLSYDLAGQISALSPLKPILAAQRPLGHLDLSELEFSINAKGNVLGVVSDVDARGMVQLSPNPERTANGQGVIEIRAAHVDWDEGSSAIRVPAATWRAALHGDGTRRAVVGDLDIEALNLGFGSHSVKVRKLHDQTTVTLDGSPDTGTVDLVQRQSIGAIQQSFAPMYSFGDVTVDTAIHRGADGVLKLSNLRVENHAAGSTLTAQGTIDLGSEAHRLALHTRLEQDLARVSNQKDLFTGRGRAALALSVQSPDSRVFHTEALVHLDDAQLELPSRHIAFSAVDGEVPIECSVVLDRAGVELLHGGQANPYMTHRFADQHPLLSHQNFLSIGSVKTPWFSLAPFAANIEVAQNIVSLSQLEVGLRGGNVSGNGVLEWKGDKSKLHADLRASGVLSSQDEPFDGNASLVVNLADHSIEGRADILRIGRQHLLDMLDVQDPYRADASLNRIRSLLGSGYPKRVNIAFKHGFASAGVSFGGLAGLVKVEEIRGIPIGSLVDEIVRAIQTEDEP